MDFRLLNRSIEILLLDAKEWFDALWACQILWVHTENRGQIYICTFHSANADDNRISESTHPQLAHNPLLLHARLK